MKVAYLDCISGISGDMTLGALVDVGVPLEALQDGVASLGLANCRLESEEVHRKGFRATKVHVRHEPEHAHRHLHHITDMIDASALTVSQKRLATDIFTRLGEAEAHVHGTTLRKVHFHEVGAIDSIADIVGSAIGWDLLGTEKVYCSPVPTGHGFIEIAHGRVSVPAPATAELLKGIPLAPSSVEAELTTPTGAAIVATLANEFGNLPSMSISEVGFGAGDWDFDTQPNVLRLVVGEMQGSVSTDQVCVIETNVDDLSGEVVAHCTDLLMKAGALDVYTTAIQMKKNRPAIQISVICQPVDRVAMEQILFAETTTLGVRYHVCDRTVLPRESHTVETQWGKVAGKVAELPNGSKRFAPEYDACQQIAAENSVPLSEVMEAARGSFSS